MYLIIMDTSLKVYCKSSLNKMYDSSIEVINKIEKVGGCLTMNFHPCYINTPMFKLYEKILVYLRTRDCVFLNSKEIYESCLE